MTWTQQHAGTGVERSCYIEGSRAYTKNGCSVRLSSTSCPKIWAQVNIIDRCFFLSWFHLTPSLLWVSWAQRKRKLWEAPCTDVDSMVPISFSDGRELPPQFHTCQRILYTWLKGALTTHTETWPWGLFSGPPSPSFCIVCPPQLRGSQ